MKKLFILFALLITGFTYSQVSMAKVLKLVEITTATRDGLSIAVNEFPVIYNGTTNRFERYNGATWEEWDVGSSEINDLSAAVTWVNVPDANITQSSVTQHQAALSIEGAAIASTGEILGTKFLREDGDGTSSWVTIPGGGDALTSSPLSQFATTTSAQLASVISNETGTGVLVFGTSPTLTTPTLGVATATSINGGTLSGNNSGDQSSIVGITGTVAQFNTAITDGSIGTGDALVANPLSQFAATTSAQLAATISDEAGSGSLLFGSGTNTGDQDLSSYVTKVGTPVNDQIGIFTGDGTIEGDANLVYSAGALSIGGVVGANGFNVAGSTSGVASIVTPAVAGTPTLTLPDVTGTFALISDTAYDAGWNGNTDDAPTKNAIYDKIETIGSATISDTAFGVGWNTDTTTGASKNALYDEMITRVEIHPESDEAAVRVGIFDDQASVDAATLLAGDVAICAACKNYSYPQIAISDLTTTLTTGDVKGFWIAPADGTIETSANNGISIYLLTPGTATGVTMEIDKNGSDITTTGVRTDATENDSDDYSSTKFVLTTSTFVRGDKFEFNLDAVPTAAAGALVTMRVYYDEDN